MLVIGSFGKKSGKGGGPEEPEVFVAVRAYWEALRIEGALPTRAMIDPRGLASALEQVFLLERIAVGHARFRLAGNSIHDLMGMDVRGMPFSTQFEPVGRHGLQPLLEAVLTGPQALHLRLEAERGIGRPALSARMMLLPLIGRRDEAAMALGVLDLQGSIGRAPRRFHIATARLESLGLPETRQVILRKEDLSTPDFVETPISALRKPKQDAKPALRLVHSRDD